MLDFFGMQPMPIAATDKVQYRLLSLNNVDLYALAVDKTSSSLTSYNKLCFRLKETETENLKLQLLTKY